MKPKTMILMGLAIACGLGAAVMTSKLVARGGNEEEMVNILVAKKDINVGDLLKKPEELFVVKAYSVKDLPENAVREKDIESLKNKTMKRGLRKNDHITTTELYGDKDQIEIPEGHYAVGMRVNIESSASGFAIQPRSRVDVLVTVKVNNNDIDKSYVQVLLQDVLLLAADTKTEREGITATAQVVTLALSPADVQAVTGASEMGTLKLSLRKPGDHSRAEKTVMTFREIKERDEKQGTVAKTDPAIKLPEPITQEPTKPGVVVDAKPEDKTPPTIKSTVTTINGNRIEHTEFQHDADGNLIPSENPNPQPAPAQRKKRTGPTDA